MCQGQIGKYGVATAELSSLQHDLGAALLHKLFLGPIYLIQRALYDLRLWESTRWAVAELERLAANLTHPAIEKD